MQGYSINAYKTGEIKAEVFSQMTALFNAIFDKTYTEFYFRKKYTKSALGYSFHAIVSYYDKVVGSFTIIPRVYQCKGKEEIMGLACDAFIHEDYRKDELLLKKMFDSLQQMLEVDNIFFLISIPNPIAYPYWKYMVKWKDIGDLGYYILPIRAGVVLKNKFSKVISVFNHLFVVTAAWMIAPFQRRDTSSNMHTAMPYALKRDTTLLEQRFDENYVAISKGPVRFYVRFYNEQDSRVAYIMDVLPMNRHNLDYAVAYITRHFSHKTDVIMYIGSLNFTPRLLYRLPKNKEPRRQPFIGKYVRTSADKEIFEYSNWSVGLADFDNR